MEELSSARVDSGYRIAPLVKRSIVPLLLFLMLLREVWAVPASKSVSDGEERGTCHQGSTKTVGL